GEDVEQARRRLNVLRDTRVVWLEEPFVSGALSAYHALSGEAAPVGLAGGEGCHNVQMARQLIDHAGLGYVQIDTGRIGGITSAKEVVDYARLKRVTYVNHTFTSHLALAASLAPYAGLERDELCEYPFEAKPLAVELTRERLEPDAEGMIRLGDGPGLGVTPDPAAIRKYLVETEIRIGGRVLYRTPAV
ncbi:MAG: enolase C-terminal domain-like protein, partial [bacterium]